MEQDPNQSLFELQVDYDSASSFREASRWTKFIAIVYFIFLGLGVLGLAFASSTIITAFGNYMPEFLGVGGVLIAVLFIVVAIYIVVAVFLYRFATLTREGIERQDQQTFNEGIKSLKNYFLITGVIALLSMVFRVIIMLTTI